MSKYFSQNTRSVIIIIFGDPIYVDQIVKSLNDSLPNKSIIINGDKNLNNLRILTLSRDECGNFKNIELLENCNKSKYTTKDFEIFGKISRFENCHFGILGVHYPPFSILDQDDWVSDGIELKIILIVASHLNMKIRNYNTYETRNTFVLGKQIVEMGCNAPPIYMSRYYSERYSWFVPHAKSQAHWSSLMGVFKAATWVCIILCLILVSLTLKYLGCQEYKDTVKCVLNTWSLFLNVGINNIPRNVSLRTLFLSWMLFSISCTNVFQAFMTSYYIDPGMKHQINTIEELDQSDLLLAIYYSVYNHIYILHDSTKTVLLAFYNEIDMFELYIRNSNVAALSTEDTILYSFRLCFNNMSSSFHKITDSVVSVHRYLELFFTSPFVPLVNQITTRLVEAGIVDKIAQDFLDPSGWTRGVIMTQSDSYDYEPLSMFHMTSSFIYHIFGYVLSMFVFITEILLFHLSPTY
ncbi:hypothetical protein L9F63_024722 [Diploptera punctata]|uniref:Uncharacterized protein n=1 Tax=Diploptera punctata TaxID=6984 RepID=A0AAD7ZES7_DIPPU|nr:hypothetical protein L9F63_024722 [Diploptera punctata]